MEQEKLVLTKNKFLVHVWIPIVFAIVIFVVAAIITMFTFESFISSYTVNKGKNEITIDTECTLSDFEGESVALSDVEFPKNNSAFGEVEINSAGIKCPLFFGNSDEVFENGAGLYIGSSIPGYGKTSIISAHNNSFFKGLDSVGVDDEIIVRTTYGVYRYKVLNVGIYQNNDPSAYTQSDSNTLILYTCHRRFGTIGKETERLFVRATLVSGPIIAK